MADTLISIRKRRDKNKSADPSAISMSSSPNIMLASSKPASTEPTPSSTSDAIEQFKRANSNSSPTLPSDSALVKKTKPKKKAVDAGVAKPGAPAALSEIGAKGDGVERLTRSTNSLVPAPEPRSPSSSPAVRLRKKKTDRSHSAAQLPSPKKADTETEQLKQRSSTETSPQVRSQTLRPSGSKKAVDEADQQAQAATTDDIDSLPEKRKGKQSPKLSKSASMGSVDSSNSSSSSSSTPGGRGLLSTTRSVLLSDMLTDPTYASFFKTFLRSEFADENLEFYASVGRFRELKQKERFRAAKLIYSTFLSLDAPRSVNLPFDLSQPIHEWYKAASAGTGSSADIPETFFSDCEQAILDTMSADTFPRFLQSVFFVSLLQVSNLTQADSASFNLPDMVYRTFIDKCTTQDQKIWRFSGTKNGVDRYYSSTWGTSGFYAARGVVEVDEGTPDDFKDWIFNFDKSRKSWDANFVKGSELKRYSDFMNISYMHAKLPSLFLQDRDVVLVRAYKKMQDGSICIIFKSVEYAECPPKKGIVRADCESSGWYMKPLPSGKTQIVYINQVDLKGNVPKKIVNDAAITRMELPKHMAIAFAKWKNKQQTGSPNQSEEKA